MTAYMDLNGIPATGNRWLFTEVLRDTWGFEGFVVSDANAVRNLRHPRLRRRPDRRRRPRRQRRRRHGDGDRRPRLRAPARGAGVRRDATPRRSTRACGACSRRRSGWACSTTRTSTRTAPARCSPTRRTARWPGSPPSGPRCCCATRATCCRSTPAALGSIAVIGPLADSQRDTLGPWVFDFDLDETVTVLDGIRARAGDGVRVEYARGVPRRAARCSRRCSTCSAATRPTDPEGFDEEAEFQRAVDLAGDADVAVVVVGEWQNMIGEAASRSSLELPGRQLELLQAVVATGTPVVLLVMNGRPLDLRWAAENVPAILDIWYPGTQGGAAVANLLFGDVSPGGKLPFTWPRTVGQVPMIYSHTRSHEPENQARRYWDEASTPLFPFGYGLSYGRFEYADLTVDQPADHRRRDRHRVGRRHQHRRIARPTRSSSSTSTSDTARRRARSASSRASSGSRSRPGSRARVAVPGRAGRAALLERGGPRLGDRRLDLRRLGRRRLDRPAVGNVRGHRDVDSSSNL